MLKNGDALTGVINGDKALTKEELRDLITYLLTEAPRKP
jgi:hypothetical protein